MSKQIITVVDAPEVTLSENENPGEALLKFYRGLGWNGEDTVNPYKVRTTKTVFNNLFEVMYKNCPDHRESVGMTMVNIGPGTDDYIPPGKVYLLEGWITPSGQEESQRA
jgi:hypothetical protein